MPRPRSLNLAAALMVLALLSACTATPTATVVPEARATATAAVLLEPTGDRAGATAVAVPGTTPTAAAPLDIASVGNSSLFVLHTNDVMGYTDPCGCQPPKGGLARRAGMIAAQRGAGAPMLLLDAGNTLFSRGNDSLTARSEGRLTVAAMNEMGYDAMAIGPSELAAGVDLLQARMAEAEFAVLSANVELDGEPLAEPYVIVERDGIEVAVLGLTSTKDAPEARFTVSDPLEAAREYVPRLEQEADVVIVLSNLGTGAEDELKAAAAGADLIINGGYGGPSSKVAGAETPGVVRGGGLGEYVGLTQLRLSDDGRSLAYAHESVVLGPGYSEDADMVALMAEYAREYAD